MKKSNKIFQLTIVLMAIIFLMSSCEKEDPKDEILNTIEGKWEVKSYLAGYDSSYYYDTDIWIDLFALSGYQNFIMEFEEYKNGEGDFEWQFWGNDSYYNETLTGEYECNAAGDELELTFSDSYQMEMEVFLNGDNLTLCSKSGYALSEGEAFIIEARRK